MKKSPSSKFYSYIGQFQDKYNDSTNIDLNKFMRDIVIKYKYLFEDRQWGTKSKKDVEILAFTIQIQEPKILFVKQSFYQERNKINHGSKNDGNNGSNNSCNNCGSSWKTIASEIWRIVDKIKEQVHLALVKIAQILDRNAQFKKIRMRNDTTTDITNNTESSNKKSFNINIASLESNNMTKNIFGMITSAHPMKLKEYLTQTQSIVKR